MPLIVDGTRTTVRGELWRYPAPRWWLWLALLAILLAIGGSPILLRRRALYGPGASACAVIAATAAIVIVVAFASDAYASPGAWIEGADATAFLVVGVWVLLCGPARWRMAAAAGAGLVALAVGLLEGAIFLHPIVLAILPATVIRTADTLAIAAGVGAALLGGLCYLDTPLPNPAVAPRGPGRSAPPGHRTADRTSHA